ncbi:MAG: penicillin acylase family protein, partial [Planctomycetaceae bacterium]|nr:penicillin acylase family protein [Planctomycetaceae bacterium]
SHDIRPGAQEWARWQGFHRVEELPQVLNPPCGYVLNTNSGPQNVCPDVAPQAADYPPYMMGQSANARSKRLSSLLAADESISPDEVRAYAADNYLIAADVWVPRLVKLLTGVPSDHPQHAAAQQAARVLEQWDRRTDVDSRGAALFVRLAANTPLLEKLAESGEAPQELVDAVFRELAETRAQLGGLDAPWGDYSRIRRGDLELAVAGCGFREPRLSPFIALRPTYGAVNQGKRYAMVGSSYGMIVDFAEGVSAVSCLPFGVSEHPSSPHFADHLPLYAQGKFKPAWFEPAEIAANKGTEIVLTLPAR